MSICTIISYIPSMYYVRHSQRRLHHPKHGITRTVCRRNRKVFKHHAHIWECVCVGGADTEQAVTRTVKLSLEKWVERKLCIGNAMNSCASIRVHSVRPCCVCHIPYGRTIRAKLPGLRRQSAETG